MTQIPRSIKDAFRTIKSYCYQQICNEKCADCDICYILRNSAPYDWDIEQLELETNCQYKNQCSEFLISKIRLQTTLREKNKLIADNEVLKVTNTVLLSYLDKKVPNWRDELGDIKL